MENIELPKDQKAKSSNLWTKKYKSFYEDENFTVDQSCHGEFGGYITFTQKSSKNKYVLGATCPVIINNIDGKYYLTSTLAHLMASSEIVEIDNPLHLTLENPEIRSSETIKGKKVVLDSIGVFTLLSFKYDDTLFHITTDSKKMYLSEIKNGKFENVMTIAEKSFWSHDPISFETTDGHFVSIFENDQVDGYIEIIGNTIKIFTYR